LEIDICVRIGSFYHNSLTDGPGRRSSVLFQFCPLKCKNCWVPHLHDAAGGVLVSAGRLADLLLDEKYERDGVTILGGEPFAQPDALYALVKALRSKNCPHIVCYSGYTLEVLREKAVKQTAISEVLNEIDVLIDGAYVESLSSSAGLWTGSGNQHVIDLRASAKHGEVVLY
jgi:anaerobic ribonucleoside-triphosphate reductase activating protein